MFQSVLFFFFRASRPYPSPGVETGCWLGFCFGACLQRSRAGGVSLPRRQWGPRRGRLHEVLLRACCCCCCELQPVVVVGSGVVSSSHRAGTSWSTLLVHHSTLLLPACNRPSCFLSLLLLLLLHAPARPADTPRTLATPAAIRRLVADPTPSEAREVGWSLLRGAQMTPPPRGLQQARAGPHRLQLAPSARAPPKRRCCAVAAGSVVVALVGRVARGKQCTSWTLDATVGLHVLLCCVCVPGSWVAEITT
ncbi:hypothetical protein EDC01DRAFT_59420 [Geopyxis carbonaria]|nr:hypothetical protein EDC01DRAFT_59420 [Geopyxis carbonaria]